MADERSSVMDFFQKVMRKKKDAQPKQPKPEDLAYVGVTKTGTARTAADAITKHNQALEDAAKD